jgi:hypothetical protein
MSHKTYPWRAVETVRENSETTAKERHSERVNELQQARAELAQIARAKHQKDIELRASERAWFTPQRTCLAAEAQRQASYAESLRQQGEALKESLERAESRVREDKARQEQARVALQKAHAGRKVVERHRDGFEVAQKREVERQAEIEAEDNATARRR